MPKTNPQNTHRESCGFFIIIFKGLSPMCVLLLNIYINVYMQVTLTLKN